MDKTFVFRYLSIYERFLRAVLMIPFVLIIIMIILLLAFIVMKDNLPNIIMLSKIVGLAYSMFLTMNVISQNIWMSWGIHLFKKSEIRHRQLTNAIGYQVAFTPLLITKSFLYLVGAIYFFEYFTNESHNKMFLAFLMYIATIACYFMYLFSGVLLECTRVKNKLNRRDVIIQQYE